MMNLNVSESRLLEIIRLNLKINLFFTVGSWTRLSDVRTTSHTRNGTATTSSLNGSHRQNIGLKLYFRNLSFYHILTFEVRFF